MISHSLTQVYTARCRVANADGATPSGAAAEARDWRPRQRGYQGTQHVDIIMGRCVDTAVYEAFPDSVNHRASVTGRSDERAVLTGDAHGGGGAAAVHQRPRRSDVVTADFTFVVVRRRGNLMGCGDKRKVGAAGSLRRACICARTVSRGVLVA